LDGFDYLDIEQSREIDGRQSVDLQSRRAIGDREIRSLALRVGELNSSRLPVVFSSAPGLAS